MLLHWDEHRRCSIHLYSKYSVRLVDCSCGARCAALHYWSAVIFIFHALYCLNWSQCVTLLQGNYWLLLVVIVFPIALYIFWAISSTIALGLIQFFFRLLSSALPNMCLIWDLQLKPLRFPPPIWLAASRLGVRCCPIDVISHVVRLLFDHAVRCLWKSDSKLCFTIVKILFLPLNTYLNRIFC